MAESKMPTGDSPRDSPRAGIRHLEFGEDISFQKELRRRVDEYFLSPGRRKRDCWQMYLKTAVILACFGASWVLLVFVAQTLWSGLLLAAALGLSMAGVGFNIQHDGGHQAYSERAWVNRLMAWTLDLMGTSSARWRWKHAVIHHRYVNITGYDDDIDPGWLGRFSPHQPWRWYERWQHIYLWPLYGLFALKIQLFDDLRYVVMGRVGAHTLPRPSGRELVYFAAGKALFLSWMLVIPVLRHPLWMVLFFYGVAVVVLGTVMVLVFVTPHLVSKADFPMPREDTGRMENPWAVHQARVTVDFAVRNPVTTWLLGGLNYHKEHHLFPTICHINYPGMARIVQKTCEEFDVPYHTHSSFFTGVAAHYRWLHRMGRKG